MLKLSGAWLCGLYSVPQGSGLSRLRSSDDSAPPFHAAEIPLLLELLGSAGDLSVASPEAVIIAVGGRIRLRMFGGFGIGRGRTPLGSDLIPYLEIL